MVKEHCPWLLLNYQSSLWRLLQRLDIHYKRGRDSNGRSLAFLASSEMVPKPFFAMLAY